MQTCQQGHPRKQDIHQATGGQGELILSVYMYHIKDDCLLTCTWRTAMWLTIHDHAICYILLLHTKFISREEQGQDWSYKPLPHINDWQPLLQAVDLQFFWLFWLLEYFMANSWKIGKSFCVSWDLQLRNQDKSAWQNLLQECKWWKFNTAMEVMLHIQCICIFIDQLLTMWMRC